MTEDAIIDLANPDVNLNNWYVQDGGARKRVLTVNGTQYVILRFDLSSLAGKQVADHGLLELTTHSVQRTSDPLKDFGLVRVVEILGGDPAWDQKTVTADSLRRGQPIDRVLNSQMIIDWPVTEGDGGKTYFTISRPVLAADDRRADAGDRHQAPGIRSARRSTRSSRRGPGGGAGLLFSSRN